MNSFSANTSVDVEYIRILLVEDNTDTAGVLQQILELDGSDVQVAYDIGEALRLADTHTFDLVICDIGLPDGDGRELMRLLHRKYHLTGIAISGYCTLDQHEMLGAGFRRFLPKPITFEAISSAIAGVMGERKRKSA